jgi:hypothetical protein
MCCHSEKSYSNQEMHFWLEDSERILNEERERFLRLSIVPAQQQLVLSLGGPGRSPDTDNPNPPSTHSTKKMKDRL